MKCPSCNIMLVSADRHGIDIDYCPCCWGVWLDKGELNQILERAQAEQSAALPISSGEPARSSWGQYSTAASLASWR